MKKSFQFMFFFFLIGLFIGGGIFFFTQEASLENRVSIVEEHLIREAGFRSLMIKEALLKMKLDIQNLSEDSEVMMLLNEDLVLGESALVYYVDERSEVIAKEIENYLNAFPELSLSDLKNSDEFWNIAVQPLGKSGYSYVYGRNTYELYFANLSEDVGIDFEDLREANPELMEMVDYTRDNEEGYGGFHYWDPTGIRTKKYGRIINIPIKTSDGVELSVIVVGYLKDYFVVNNSSEILENFERESGYHNLILISPNGSIVYMTENASFLGTNLEWETNSDFGVSLNYFRVKEIDGLYFYGPFAAHYGEDYPKLSVIAPVFDSGNLIGYVGLIEDMDKFFGFLNESDKEYSAERYYLINSAGFLISPLENDASGLFVQKIDTENTNNCLSKGFEDGAFDFYEFVDFQGETAFGTDFFFEDVGWCLLVEVERADFSSFGFTFVQKDFLLYFLFLVFFSLIGFIIGSCFDRGFFQKNFLCCRFVRKVGNVSRNAKIGSIFAFSLIFVLAYFFLVTYFFQGWQYAAWYDEISDLTGIFVLSLMFFYGFKLKKSARVLVSLGCFFAIIDKMTQIILEEYIYMFGVISSFYWIWPACIGYVGLFMIFFGFKEVMK